MKMKKIFIITVVLCLLMFNLAVMGSEYNRTSPDYNKQLISGLIEKAPFDYYGVADTWAEMSNESQLILINENTNGKKKLIKTGGSPSENEQLIIDALNKLIEHNVITYENGIINLSRSEQEVEKELEKLMGMHGETGITEAKILDPNVLSGFSEYSTNGGNNMQLKKNEIELRQGYQNIDLLQLCEENWVDIEFMYILMSSLSQNDPTINAWMFTMLYWVDLVREGGDWDYKVKDGFSPWYTTFFTVFDGTYHYVE